MIRLLRYLCLRFSDLRPPDVVISPGDAWDNPDYLMRWYVIPRNPLFNIYLHRFGRSDEDRALHDHPWLFNCSVVLDGFLAEHTINAGGVNSRRRLMPGSVRFRLGPSPHRLELQDECAWTLFITGPRVRNWGFHCPHVWVPWQQFTDPADSGKTGRGCE